MKSLRAFVALAAIAALPARSAANLSDLWFDPTQPGWGMNVVQQQEVAFVTLFVYGPDGEPAWYVVPNAETFAYSSEGLSYLRGTLYRTRGPWFGGVFDPANVHAGVAGEMTIEPISSSEARLTYRVGAVAVSRTVTRQTWRSASPDQPFDARFSLRQIDAEGRTMRRAYSAMTTWTIEGGTATMTVLAPDGRCDYVGGHRQTGRLADIAGRFHCADGRSGPFEVRDLEFTSHGFSARIEASWTGGGMHGWMGGPRY